MPRLAGFAERVHEPFYPTVVLTDRQFEIVTIMKNGLPETWFRPMDLGAHDTSHHHKTLRQLMKKRLVVRRARIDGAPIEDDLPTPAILSRRRGRHSPRGSYVYQLSELGRDDSLVLRRKK